MYTYCPPTCAIIYTYNVIWYLNIRYHDKLRMHREPCTCVFSSHLCAAAARMTELLPLEEATSKVWENFGFSTRDIEPDEIKNSVVSCKLRESEIWWQCNELTSSPLWYSYWSSQRSTAGCSIFQLFGHSNNVIHGNNLSWYFTYISITMRYTNIAQL